jgi:HK97 family phage major capsid protein
VKNDPAISELRARAAVVLAEIENLSCIDEADMTADELRQVTELAIEAEQLTTQINRGEKVKELGKLIDTPSHVGMAVPEGPHYKDHVDPWEDDRSTGTRPPKAVSAGWEESPQHHRLRDRALSALDERVSPGFDELPVDGRDRERIEKLLRDEDKDSDLARYVIAASRPAYHTAFNKVMSGRMMFLSDEERAAFEEVERTRIRREAAEGRSTLSTTNASAMLPYFLDPTWIITGAGALNPFRQIASTVTIPTNVWHGVNATQLVAEWTSELAEMTSAEPTISGPTVTPAKADMYVQASWEAIGDTDVATAIGAAFVDGKAIHETAAFTNGTGVNQPKGIVTIMSTTTASRVNSTTNGQLGAVDVFALVSNLPARFQDRAAWIGHWGIFNLIRQMSPSGPGSNFWLDLGAPLGDGQSLLGAPAYRVSAMQSALSTATASNDDGILILGDWSRFQIVDRIGLEVTATPVFGSNLRPVGATGFAAWWRVGSDTTDANAFRGLRC